MRKALFIIYAVLGVATAAVTGFYIYRECVIMEKTIGTMCMTPLLSLLVAAILGKHWLQHRIDRKRCSVYVMATVLEMKRVHWGKTHGYVPIVCFDVDGKFYTVEISFLRKNGWQSEMYRRGDEYPIRYDPSNPAHIIPYHSDYESMQKVCGIVSIGMHALYVISMAVLVALVF